MAKKKLAKKKTAKKKANRKTANRKKPATKKAAKKKHAKAKHPGLWDNIHAKRKRIESGSGETMRELGSKGAPTQQSIHKSQATSKKKQRSRSA